MKPRLVAILQALFVVFLWATSYVFIKSALNDIGPITFAGLRYTLAFLCLLVVLVLNGGGKAIRALPGRAWIQLIILGLFFYTGTQGASFVGLSYLPAVTLNLIWSFCSIVVAILGIVWLSEKPTPFQWTGIFTAMLGAFIFFFPVTVPKGQVIGIAVALLGVLANAISTILGRQMNRANQLSALLLTTVSMGIGSTVLLAAGILVEGVPVISLRTWAIIGWLAVVNTALAFTLWNRTMRILTAMESSIINGTMLIWIPVFAVLFLGEQLTAKGIVGLAAVGLGTLIVQLRTLPYLPGRMRTIHESEVSHGPK